MKNPVSFRLHDANLWLSPERCIYWEDQQTLIVSDLHFGKTGHFRKSGIPVPQHVFKEDLQRLVHQIQFFKPAKLLVVGDLFHSVANKELELFAKWRHDLPDLDIHLVKGNHDILKESWYGTAGIQLFREGVNINGFCFTHDSLDCYSETQRSSGASKYTISGHIHPGIRVNGGGRQTLCLPCYYFGKDYAILPAFSRFTGTAIIEPRSGDKVFALVDRNIVEVC